MGLTNVVVVSCYGCWMTFIVNNSGPIICILSGNCPKEYVYCRVCYTQERAGMMPGHEVDCGPGWTRRRLGGGGKPEECERKQHKEP